MKNIFKSFAGLKINSSSYAKAIYGIAALVLFFASIIICNSILTSDDYREKEDLVENYSTYLSNAQESEFHSDTYYNDDPELLKNSQLEFEKDKQYQINTIKRQYKEYKPFLETQKIKAYTILVLGLMLAFFSAYIFVILARRDKKINDEKKTKEKEAYLASYKAHQEAWKKKHEAKEKQKREEERKLFEDLGHGRPIKSVPIRSDCSSKGLHYLDNRICVFADDYLTIQGKLYKFTDILDFDAMDNTTLKETSYTSSNGTSKTSNGNMAIRSGVGYALAGPAGAIIGGTTSKKNNVSYDKTETTTETKHHYEIVVVVNDFKKPQIVLDFKNNKSLFFEVKSILTIILNKNRGQITTK